MSLQTRLDALITAIGADVKSLQSSLNSPMRASAAPIRFYGDSYAVTPAQIAGVIDYPTRIGTLLGATIDNYSLGGRRIIEISQWLINGLRAPIGSTTNPRGSSATWPGVSAASCWTVLDSIGNDIGHYPSMVAAGGAVPAYISGAAGDRYLSGIRSALGAALALFATESRVEFEDGILTGTFGFSGPGPYSGDSTRYTTVIGNTAQVTVTPPQTGPYAGEVFILSATVDSAFNGTVPANWTYSIDGGAESALIIPPSWEMFTGHGGTAAWLANYVQKITLPIDNASHTIRMTHAGGSGGTNTMYPDAVLVPSEDPWPTFVMGNPRRLKVGTTWDATQMATYHGNTRKITDVYKNVIAQFPHSIWVPSSVSPNGISVDGLHPNDRGMEQRANDLLHAFRMNRAVVAGIESRFAPDSNYGVV